MDYIFGQQFIIMILFIRNICKNVCVVCMYVCAKILSSKNAFLTYFLKYVFHFYEDGGSCRNQQYNMIETEDSEKEREGILKRQLWREYCVN